MSWSEPVHGAPLAGLRVVDFGQYVAGPLAAGLLAEQGADVIHVDPPGGPRWDSPANAILLRARRSVVLDLRTVTGREEARSLLRSADVAVENFRPGVMDRLGLGPSACLADNPRLVYCSLPGFGAGDCRAAVPAWEGVVMAAGGAYHADRPLAELDQPALAERHVRFSPFPLASVFAALEAALGIAAALVARDRDGLGQWVEVPLFDALFEASGVRTMAYERNFPRMTQFGAGFYRCVDGGYISLSTMWLRHLEWLVEAAGVEGWREAGLLDFDRLWSEPAVSAEVARRLVELFAGRPAAEWERLGRAAGVPLAMLRSTAEWVCTPQAVESGAVIRTDDPLLGSVPVPGQAVVIGGWRQAPDPRRLLPADAAAQAGAEGSPPVAGPPVAGLPATGSPVAAPPLDGLQVVDITRVLAGPTAARLLGQLGATVVKVDADPAASRCSIPEPMVHEHANRGKRGLVLDLKTPGDQAVLARLAARADVVVENFTVGVAERLGIDLGSLRRVSPEVVLVYLNAYGTAGPWAADRGYAELANVVTGLTARTCGPDHPSGPPNTVDVPPWPFTDYAAGVLAAFGAVVGLYARSRWGRGVEVEASLVRAALLEQVIYLPPDPDASPARADAVGWGPGQRLYRTRDSWVFVGSTPAALGRLATAVGADAAPCEGGADRLDEAVAQALERLPTSEVVAAAVQAGAGAHEVVPVADLMVAGGVAAQRGLRLEEQTESFGTVVMAGPVIRLQRTPLRPGSIPAPFGTDTAGILAELGM